MHIEQVDLESRIPYSDGLDGYYYYSNTFFYDLDNPPDDNTSWYWLTVALSEGTYNCAERTALKRTDPPGSGIFVGGGQHTPVAGALTFTGGYSPFDIVRMNFYAADSYVGYKLWRMPLVNEAFSVDAIDSGVLSYLQGQIVDTLLFAKITTRAGLPIDRIDVSPRVHMWGFRHGTKRRARRVLIFP